jgi:hypothetical protein
MLVQAFLRAMPREVGERFLREVGQIAADEELVHPLLPNRPLAQRGEQRRAQREAVLRLRLAMPLWVASLPPFVKKKRKG